uniref:Uncharacterized protein n=1 Tax=Anguilla anguilla TaxID=7936 RepID=A0A0E9TDV2_ANGAN
MRVTYCHAVSQCHNSGVDTDKPAAGDLLNITVRKKRSFLRLIIITFTFRVCSYS